MPPPGEPKNIRLQGPQWEPPGYDVAPMEARKWYWKTLGDIAHEIKREEISRGIGISGRPLKPIIQKYRKDGATGPPLIPHDFESRTQRLLAVHVMIDGVTLFWRGHGRQSWATILGYHAYKHGPRALPVRNTIGISRGGMTKIRARAFAAWRARAKKEPPPPPVPEPPAPPPKPPRVPKPVPKPKPPVPPAPPKPPAKPPAPPKPMKLPAKYVVTEFPKRIKRAIIFTGKWPGKEPPAPPKPPAPAKPPAPPKPPKPPKPKPTPKPPAPPKAKPMPKPTGPVLPGRPIAERIAATTGAEAKRKEIAALGGQLAELRKKAAQAERKMYAETGRGASLEEIRALRQKMLEADIEAKRVATAQRQQIADILAVPPDQQANWTGAGLRTVEPLTAQRAQAGFDWLKSKLNAPGVKIEHEWHKFTPSEDRRAYHMGHTRPWGKESTVHVGPEDTPDIHVHELGHAIEWQVPGVHQRVEEFLAHRLQGEAAESMASLFPGMGYKPTEMGRKDKFDAHFDARDAYYVGLVKTNGNSEVLSMGLQALYNDPAGFARNDPEFFKFIIGILDGSLL